MVVVLEVFEGERVNLLERYDYPMKGNVARIHYAKHGQPNGVVLESGEFIHLRPHGMAAIGVGVGAKVSAKGELRMTVLGTRMLEAHHANGHDIE